MKRAAVLLLFAASPVLADLSAGSGGDSAAAGAISRLSAARQGSAAALADKDVAGDVQRGSNLVYYASLNGNVPSTGRSEMNTSSNNESDNGREGCPPCPTPTPVPAPGAALLALIGFAGVNWLKRRA